MYYCGVVDDVMFAHNHVLHARYTASPMLTATGLLKRRGKFSTPQNPHPLTDHQKIGTGDYVGGPYGCAKFGANPSMRASGQMGEI